MLHCQDHSMGSQDSFGISLGVLLGLLVIQMTICVPVAVKRFADFGLAENFGDIERTLADPMMTPLLDLGLSEDSGKRGNIVYSTDFLASTASSDPTSSPESSAPPHTRPRRAPCRGWGQSPPIPLPCR